MASTTAVWVRPHGLPFAAGAKIDAVEWACEVVEFPGPDGSGLFRMEMFSPSWDKGGQNWHSIVNQTTSHVDDAWGNTSEVTVSKPALGIYIGTYQQAGKGSHRGLADSGDDKSLVDANPESGGTSFLGREGQRIVIRPDGGVVAGSQEEVRVIDTVTGGGTGCTWSSPLTFPVTAGTRYDAGRADNYHIDGVELIANPSTSPYWGRAFINIDGLGLGPGLQLRTRIPAPGITFPPRKIRWRFHKIADSVQDPVGNLSRSHEDGAWQSLLEKPGDPWQTGLYSIWQCDVALDGANYVPVYKHWIRQDVGGYLDLRPWNLIQEHLGFPAASNDPSLALDQAPTEVRWSEVRVHDEDTDRWYASDVWDMYGGWAPGDGDDKYGWTQDDHDDGLKDYVFRVGHVEDATAQKNGETRRYLLGNVKHESKIQEGQPGEGTWAALPYKDDLGTDVSGTIVEGRMWRGAAAFPFVCHDEERGFFVLHPHDDGRDVAVVWTADEAGTYFVTGDFARFNPVTAGGNGVDAFVYKNEETTPLWTAHVPNGHAVPLPDPFGYPSSPSGSNQHFQDVGVQLAPGDRLRFAVKTRDEFSFDATALRFQVSFQRDSGLFVAAPTEDPGDHTRTEARALPPRLQGQVSRLAPGAPVDLFELDVSPIDSTQVVPFRFVPQVSRNQQPVSFRGKTYIPIPIGVTGFATTIQGALPRPTISISNADGGMSALMAQFNDFVGAKVTRIRTFESYLDGAESADPLALASEDLWIIDRPKDHSRFVVGFEMVSALDWQGQKIPSRLIYYNSCPFIYEGGVLGVGGGECNYTKGKSGDQSNMLDVLDVATVDPAQDVCGKRLVSCEARFGVGQVLPYGGFPGTQRTLK